MAESVKRRIAAARLAVAFVAAGTIAGATAWAQASPAPTADQSVLISSQKLKIGSANIKNGSLLLQDFKAGEVASQDSFFKFKSQVAKWKSSIGGDLTSIKGELDSIKTELGDIKGAQAGYVKLADADSRYLKLDATVVEGDGSVFTATKPLQKGAPAAPLVDVPGLIGVEATDSSLTVTNKSSQPLSHSSCVGVDAGELAPGATLTCGASDTAQTLQLVSGGRVSTLNFSNLPTAGGSQATVQILIGL